MLSVQKSVLFHEEVYRELSLIAWKQEDMAARAREITAELVQQKVAFTNEGRILTDLMITKRIAHAFMVDHNFDLDLQPEEIFDLWDERNVFIRYKFISRPEYSFVLSIFSPPGFHHLTICLDRVLNNDVKSRNVSINTFPQLTNVSISNDEYLIETCFVALTRKLAPLWTNFGSSTVDPEDNLPVLDL